MRARHGLSLAWYGLLALVVTGTLLFPLTLIVVAPAAGKPLLLDRIAQGDVVELGHVNSIYGQPVEEVLALTGDRLVLQEVRTPSYGVREYYRITEGIPRVGYREFTFHNGAERGFTLKIKGRQLAAVREYPDASISVQVVRRPLARYLWWLLFSR